MSKSVINFGDVDDKDDYRHDLKNNARARDSFALMLMIPEEGVAGFVYPTVNGEGHAVTTVCLFGDAFQAPIFEQFSETVNNDMDFSNWQTGGLTMKIGEPHKTLDLSWRGDTIKIDFHFEALHPPYAFSFGEDGCPPYFAKDRTEQHGRITGEITANNKSFNFESIMIRDHSWGTRIWGLNQHYKWFHAATKEISIHFFEMESFGRKQLQGFLVKDGLMTKIKNVEYDFVLDDDLILKSIDVSVTDDQGRLVSASSTAYAHYRFDTDPMVVLNEAATTVSIEGHDGVGWVEFCWNKNYLEYAKQFSQFK